MKNSIVKKKKKQSRTYGIIIPSEWENAKAIIMKAKQAAKHYYYIEHDRDWYSDEGEHAQGEIKKKHIHLLFTFNSSRDLSTVVNYFSEFPELKENSFELINNAYGAKRYLVHADNPEKAQYDAWEIETNDNTFKDCLIERKSGFDRAMEKIRKFNALEDENMTCDEFCRSFLSSLETMNDYSQFQTIMGLRSEWRYHESLKRQKRNISQSEGYPFF